MMIERIKDNSKILSVMLFALAIPSSSQANNPFNAFYLGIGVSESLMTGKLNSSTFASAADTAGTELDNDSLILSQNLKRNSWFGSVFGGYGYTCNLFYLGAELSLKYNNHTTATNITTSTSSFSIGGTTFDQIPMNDSTQLTCKRAEYDIDVRPGLLLSDCTLFYGRTGVAFNKISLNSTQNDSFETVAINPISITSSSSGSKRVGLRLGLGFEQMFCNCMSLRLDYVYTRYKRIYLNSATTTSNTTGGSTTIGTLLDARNIKPAIQTIMLGLSYYW